MVRGRWLSKEIRTVDIYHVFGNDLVLNANNDLATVVDVDETNQRILRRLLTAKGTYIWQTDFGASIPERIGVPISVEIVNLIKKDVKSEIFKESNVAQDPAPEIDIELIDNGFQCSIKYYNVQTQAYSILTFKVEI
jgi:hypothetical protein